MPENPLVTLRAELRGRESVGVLLAPFRRERHKVIDVQNKNRAYVDIGVPHETHAVSTLARPHILYPSSRALLQSSVEHPHGAPSSLCA